MFTNYNTVEKENLTFEDLTVDLKNSVTDAYATGGSTTSIKHTVGLPSRLVAEAIEKIQNIEQYCTGIAHVVKTTDELKTAAKAHFTNCAITALEHVIDVMIDYSNGSGDADFAHWKEGASK